MTPIARSCWLAAALLAATAEARLPAPDDAAKAKAAEAAAKAAWSAKLANYQLCKAQDRTVAHVQAKRRAAGQPAAGTPGEPCVDPGPYAPAAAPGAKP